MIVKIIKQIGDGVNDCLSEQCFNIVEYDFDDKQKAIDIKNNLKYPSHHIIVPYFE